MSRKLKQSALKKVAFIDYQWFEQLIDINGIKNFVFSISYNRTNSAITGSKVNIFVTAYFNEVKDRSFWLVMNM